MNEDWLTAFIKIRWEQAHFQIKLQIKHTETSQDTKLFSSHTKKNGMNYLGKSVKRQPSLIL